MSPPLDAFARQLIRQKARQLKDRLEDPAMGVEDLESRLQYTLLRRAPRYDPDKARWTTFVALVLDHEVADILQQASGPDRRPTVNCSSLYEPEESAYLPWDDQCRDTLRLEVQELLKQLPPEDRDFCHQIMASESVSEQARTMGRSRQAIYRRLRKLRELPEVQKLQYEF